MTKLRIYTYKNCDTCRRAVKFLRAHEVDFEERPIREQPPSIRELSEMLEACDGELKRLFNVSSRDYREGNFKDLLPGLSRQEAFKEVRANGNLVKRPFLLHADGGLVGFKEEEWRKALKL